MKLSVGQDRETASKSWVPCSDWDSWQLCYLANVLTRWSSDSQGKKEASDKTKHLTSNLILVLRMTRVSTCSWIVGKISSLCHHYINTWLHSLIGDWMTSKHTARDSCISYSCLEATAWQLFRLCNPPLLSPGWCGLWCLLCVWLCHSGCHTTQPHSQDVPTPRQEEGEKGRQRERDEGAVLGPIASRPLLTVWEEDGRQGGCQDRGGEKKEAGRRGSKESCESTVCKRNYKSRIVHKKTFVLPVSQWAWQ